MGSRVVKNIFGMLAFIDVGIEYKSWNAMLQLYQTLVILHMIIVHSSGHHTKEIHQDVV